MDLLEDRAREEEGALVSAYINLLPPDRPTNMVGQDIIRLVADGGPGGDLGDAGPARKGWGWSRAHNAMSDASRDDELRRRIRRMTIEHGRDPRSFGLADSFGSKLQEMLTQITSGERVDMPEEYFKPKEVVGLPSDQEGPATGRQGVFPKKLRDMVSYDMDSLLGGSFVQMGSAPTPLELALATRKRCDSINEMLREIYESLERSGASQMPADQQRAILSEVHRMTRALKGEFRRCVRGLRRLVRVRRKEVSRGMPDAERYLGQMEALCGCRAALGSLGFV